MDGRKPPSKYFPFPLSQMFSNFVNDEIKIFSASAAACWLSGRPNSGASTVFRTNPAGIQSIRYVTKRNEAGKVLHTNKKQHLHLCSKEIYAKHGFNMYMYKNKT